MTDAYRSRYCRVIAAREKRASACARQAAGSSPIARGSARAIAASSSQRIPVTPSITSSGAAPRR